MGARTVILGLLATAFGITLALDGSPIKWPVAATDTTVGSAAQAQQTAAERTSDPSPDPSPERGRIDQMDRQLADLQRAVQSLQAQLQTMADRPAPAVQTLPTEPEAEAVDVAALRAAQAPDPLLRPAAERLSSEPADADFADSYWQSWTQLEAELATDELGSLSVRQVACSTNVCEMRFDYTEMDPILIQHMLMSAAPDGGSIEDLQLDASGGVAYLVRNAGNRS